MNLVIETLNVWADHALRFAWPMLWQSSLLIGLLFALDLLMRRKLRPAVRYALWLVVLVKLLLPPSLAFPTNPGWWLRPAKAVPAMPRTTSVVVTYGAAELPALPTTVTPVFVAPSQPRLTPAAWALVGMVTVGLGLLAWMLMRWRQVARDARRAAVAPEWLSELLHELRGPAQIGRVSPIGAGTEEPQRRDERRERSGEEGAQANHLLVTDCQISETGPSLRSSRLCGSTERSSSAGLELRLMDQPQSPAVCGLFRPVILLPRSLAEHLPPAQLRAVLLHELLHLRRGDVWVNCAQALLQIVYWWHPLLWFANARIRRVREEAVDDGVMVALNEDAETYAPTLLEVAKLALHRPLASLGLVGILESRSSLRQRIERLMDFHPPRKAGLTLASAFAVLSFAALAVPMGEAPAPMQAPQLAGSEAVTNIPAPLGSTNAAWPEQNTNASTLVHDGKLFYEMGRLDKAEAKLKLALKEDPNNKVALYYLNLVSEAWFKAAGGDLRELLPVPSPYARTNSIRTTDKRQAIMTKLDRIRLESVSFDGLPLSEVVRFLTAESSKRDPEKRGINFVINQNIDRGGAAAATAPVLGPDGDPLPAPPPEQADMGAIVIKINPPLTDVRLADVLDAIVKGAHPPIKYSILDYAIVFSLKGRETTPLYVRTFKVNANTILNNLLVAKGPVGTNGPEAFVPALLDVFAKAGVDLDAKRNPGKAIFYDDRKAMLMVRAYMQDMDIVEQKLSMLGTAQINIKCKFVEVLQDDTKVSGIGQYMGHVLTNNTAIGGHLGTAPSNVGPPTATNPLGVFPGNPNGPTAFAPDSTNPLATSGLRIPSPSSFTLTGILTDPQYRVVIKALQQRSGTELIAQPEVTTLSGRQAQMKATEIKTVVTGINKRALTPPGITTTNADASSLYVTEKMELGPVLDVIPSALGDSYTIELTVIPTLNEFLGYEENPTNRVAVYVNGEKKWVTPPLPKFRVCQMATNVRVWDGQTVVLGGLLSETVNTIKDQVPVLGSLPLVGVLFRSESKTTAKKNLLVFITPTLIDPAGNRLHSDDEMPLIRSGVPPQAPR